MKGAKLFRLDRAALCTRIEGATFLVERAVFLTKVTPERWPHGSLKMFSSVVHALHEGADGFSFQKAMCAYTSISQGVPRRLKILE